MQRHWQSLLLTACLIAGFASPSQGQSYTLTPFVPGQYFTTSGTIAVCASCLLNAYLSGTSTRRDTYSDTSGTANANPVVLNSAGRATVYLAVGVSYRLVLTDSTGGTTYWDIDPVQAVPSNSGNTDIAGTAGEAITAGQVVFLSDGSGSQTAGRWYLADADNAYSSSAAGLTGIATAAIASAASGTIRIAGRMTGLTGLTTGEFYYVSATAGALTTTPPTNQRFIGEADTTTTLVTHGDAGAVKLPDSDGTNTLAFLTTSNLTADRTVTILTGDSNRQITVNGDPTLGTNDLTTTGSPTFTGLNLTGAIATPTNITMTGAIATPTNITMSGALAGATTGSFSSTVTAGDDLIFSANKVIRRNTSDAADSGYLVLHGGGTATETSFGSRGGAVYALGNEHATYPASVVALISTSGAFYVLRNTSTGAFSGAATQFKVDTDNVTSALITGTTTASAANVVIETDILKRSTSSARYKTDIVDIRADWRAILNLQPREFRSATPTDPKIHMGFVAEEVEKVLPTLVTYDAQGRPDWIEYPYMTAPIVAYLKGQAEEQKVLSVDPVSPREGQVWDVCAGVSPSRVCSHKLRDGGVTRTLSSVTF